MTIKYFIRRLSDRSSPTNRKIKYSTLDPNPTNFSKVEEPPKSPPSIPLSSRNATNLLPKTGDLSISKNQPQKKYQSLTMSQLSCCRPSWRWRRTKGFRVHTGKFSLHRLRFPFFRLIKLFKRWKIMYSKAVASMNHGNSKMGRKEGSSWTRRRREKSERTRGLVGDGGGWQSRTDYKLRSYGRSNSFYADAIDECLEFIKRTSASVEEESTLV